MASFDNSDYEPINHFSEDLARYKTTAANALRKFERAYKDIMGFDNSDDVPSNSLSIEDLSLNPTSPLSLDSDSRNDDEDRLFFNHNELNHHDFSLPSYFRPYRHNTCYRCHKDMTQPEPQFYMPTYKFKNFHTRPPCPYCSQVNSNNFFRTQLSTPDSQFPVQHPLVSPVKQKSSSENSSKIDFHKCPLKITIPEPFQMTIRDEGQKPIRELKIKQLKEKMNEKTEKELRVQIYSNPVPAHVYVPLFQKMMEMDFNRKEQRRKESAERMREMVKPFNFSTTRKNKLRRSDSMPDLQPEEPYHIFKAKPIPKNILSPNFSQKIKYKEDIRKYRISQRAKKMLMQSSLPFSVKRPLNRSLSCISLKQNENINQTPYRQRVRKKSHNKTMSRAERQKVMNEWNAKVVKLTCTGKYGNNEDTGKVEEKVHSQFHNFLRAKKSTLFNGAVRTTASYCLREDEIRKELEAKNKDNLSTDSESKKWQKELRNRLQTTLNDSTTSNFEKDLEAKLQSYRASRRMRQMEYERELMEIQKRIEKQPLLIERQSKATQQNKSTSTEAQDEENHLNLSSNRTLSLASSLASDEDVKSSSHSSLSEDSEHSF